MTEMDYSSIDFVITWVDGNDPAWLQEKTKYKPSEAADDSPHRYRDYDLMRYWFRGVESFAPWVNKIHLITWGHIPPWLNTAHNKLHIVRHEDYLPSSVLPCFNSNAIELCMHRIEGLSEQFVYFNDDMFLLKSVRKTDFFRNGLPVDDAIICPIIPDADDDAIGKTILNNMYVINRHFNKKTVLSGNFFNFLNPRYKAKLLRSVCLLPWRHFPGFYNDHLPVAYRKDTFRQVWLKEEKTLQEVITHRFRDCSQDLSHWLMRYWQFCSGQFCPGSPNRGITLSINTDASLDYIKGQRRKMICLNDSVQTDREAEAIKHELQNAFQSILPDPSTFEI